MNPTSATVFSSKTTLLSVPNSPGSYSPAVFPTGKLAFPLPPLPPFASVNSSSCLDKSASTRQTPYLYPRGRKCAVRMYSFSISSSFLSFLYFSRSSFSSSSSSSNTGSEDPQFATIFFVTSISSSSLPPPSVSSSSHTTVPIGTSITFVFPFFPCFLSFPPFPPFPALNKFPMCPKLFGPRTPTAFNTTSPPFPPFPPSAPLRPLDPPKSFRNDAHPFPPFPARARTRIRSTIFCLSSPPLVVVVVVKVRSFSLESAIASSSNSCTILSVPQKDFDGSRVSDDHHRCVDQKNAAFCWGRQSRFQSRVVVVVVVVVVIASQSLSSSSSSLSSSSSDWTKECTSIRRGFDAHQFIVSYIHACSLCVFENSIYIHI